jgi:hypothetical protein
MYMPIAIENADPTDIDLNTSVVQDGPVFRVDGFLTANLWGSWQWPIYIWDWSDGSGPPNEAFISRTFTNEEVASISMNGPVVLSNSVEIRDADDASRAATANISIYAPQQFPTLGETTTVYTEWNRCSPIVHRSPYALVTISDSEAYSTSVTKALTVGGGQVGVDAPIRIALEIPSFEYGETADVTHTYTISYQIPPGPDDTLFWVKKRNFWHHQQGTHFRFGQWGYIGVGSHYYDYWVSSTKAAAEMYDREVALEAVPIHP